mmetsp:Transcript_21498/g.52664  ORF Transcript_21498/g.52664 Transcript_21498/m.52664 type:complete len:149 (-) Transcript_21498:23-469(-)
MRQQRNKKRLMDGWMERREWLDGWDAMVPSEAVGRCVGREQRGAPPRPLSRLAYTPLGWVRCTALTDKKYPCVCECITDHRKYNPLIHPSVHPLRCIAHISSECRRPSLPSPIHPDTRKHATTHNHTQHATQHPQNCRTLPSSVRPSV